MGCPDCGSPLYYRNPAPSSIKGQDYDYSFAKCIGTIEREGWSTTKSGEKKYRRKYSKEPCGWTAGIDSKPDIHGSPPCIETAVSVKRHTPESTDHRVYLIDFKQG